MINCKNVINLMLHCCKNPQQLLACLQDLDTEIVIATARGTGTNATAVSANLLVDERQMNALFLDVVTI